jgi:hypothetical protein
MYAIVMKVDTPAKTSVRASVFLSVSLKRLSSHLFIFIPPVHVFLDKATKSPMQIYAGNTSDGAKNKGAEVGVVEQHLN